ncbi:MAG TPA: glycosyltransferase [Nitrospirae bacterium]|nr:glycosyltransferase [Nitrospirota bacterium]
MKKIHYSGRALRVCVVGSDDHGWALDTEARLAKENLSKICEVVEYESEADVIHSVWPDNTAMRWDEKADENLPAIVLSFSNAPSRMLELPKMYPLMQKSVALIAQGNQALNELRSIGFDDKSFLAPYPYDSKGYEIKDNDDLKLSEIRSELNIPAGAYVIGNFFRDSLGADTRHTKPQKGADIFLAIIKEASSLIKDREIIVLLAGPRRHWLRRELKAAGVPFRFYGKLIEGDDYPVNILPSKTLKLLYRLCDLQVAPSRWEGAPRALMECSLTGVPIISTRVGIAEDVLPKQLLFDDVSSGSRLIVKDAQQGFARSRLTESKDKLEHFSSERICVAALRRIYTRVAGKLGNNPDDNRPERHVVLYPENRRISVTGATRRIFRFARRMLYRPFKNKQSNQMVVTLWNNFQPPPYGGANQFFLALEKWLGRRGVITLRNDWKRKSDAHIFNSIWFDYNLMDELKRQFPESVFAHRIDGPISRYRDTEPELNDDIVFAVNKYMDVTLFQSLYSMRGCLDIGYKPARPNIIRNSVDADTFNMEGKSPFSHNRKLRLITTAWSANVKKGRDIYVWLDKNLDFSNIEYTFVGNCDAEFKNINKLPPVPSEEVAQHLKYADIYIFASVLESASNAVLEALACGLPVIYVDSGGTREIVGMGGLGWADQTQIPEMIELIRNKYYSFQQCIAFPTMDDIVDKYMEAIEYGKQIVLGNL